MWRTAGILVFLILCLSVALVGFQNSFALSQPSVKATVDGKAVVFEIRNPKSNSVPICQLKMVADTGILSGKPPSGWSMKRQTTLVYSDTAVFFSSSNPLAAGKSAQFAYTSAGLSTSITWYAYDRNAKLVAQGAVKTPFYKILGGLQHNDLAMLDVYSAFKNTDSASGKDSIKKARNSLFQTRADYEIIKYDFTKSDRKSIETVLNNEDKTISFVERALFLFQQTSTLGDELKEAPVDNSEKMKGVAKEIELLGYSFLKVSDDANSISSDLTVSLKDPLIKEIYTRRGYDIRALVTTFSELGTSAKSTGQSIISAASRIYQAYNIHSSVKDTEIPSEKKATNNSDLVPSGLARFFDTFDKDHDKKIDLTEAQAFYNWVELNIAYRYDDEDEKDPVQGTVVGDSRKGPDYGKRHTRRTRNARETAKTWLRWNRLSTPILESPRT